MRRSISVAALVLLAAAAFAQPFGRFGYVEKIDVPEFDLDRTGFRVRHDRADRFGFEEPSKVWNPVETTDLAQVILFSGIGRSPLKARVDLFAAGFSLYFQNGIGFKLGSTSAPYLTWAEGSVGPGVPTPNLKWVLVSFRDAQPPVLIALMGPAAAFEITGKAGDWRLRTSGLYRGWTRITAPIGLRAQAANSAASLGELKKRVLSMLPFLTEPIPKLTRIDITDEPAAVTASWVFDRPYALIPTPAVLANLGGYPLKLESPTVRIDSSDPAGPLSVTTTPFLSIRFPVLRIPTGRSLALGAPKQPAIGTVSPIDTASVAELSLANLPACRDVLTREAAEETMSKYLSEAAYSVEPYTNQRLPYAADGSGLDVAAAQALLMQSTITTVKATSEPNSLLTSVMWRRDWRTWRIWSPDPAVSRRAGALAALAGALCPEPSRRLDAAMLEAGLAAEAGLAIWQKRNGFSAPDKLPSAPWSGLRKALFLYANPPPADEGFVRSLLSEIRVYGESAVSASPKNGGIALAWKAESSQPVSLMLASAYPIEISPSQNLASAAAEEALGFTVIRCVPEGAGPCELLVKTPEWASPLPPYVDAPRYVPTELQYLVGQIEGKGSILNGER